MSERGTCLLMAREMYERGQVRGVGAAATPCEELRYDGSSFLRVNPMARHISTRIASSSAGDVLIASFSQEQLRGEETADVLTQEFATLAQHPRVLLEFSNVTEVGSLIFAKFLSLSRNIRAVGGQLRICGMSDRIREAVKRLQFDRFLEIHETEPEALASFH